MELIESRVRKVVSSECSFGVKAEDIKLTDILDDDLGFDSIEMGSLMMAVSKEFHVQGKPYYKDVQDIVDTVIRQLGERA